MKYLSVCSGIEAASVAWEPLGWEPLAFSEIEPFPRAVLQHHYPNTPLHGDFTELKDQPWIMDADLLCGGTPCQAFSVAGLRQSLADDRGNLTLQFVLLADAIDHLRSTAGREPAWILWENVPGVLSTNDNAFGAFLGGLVGRTAPIPEPEGGWTGAGVVDGPTRCAAWRVLDAQHFGLAQRRKRVFVLARGGAGRWAVADALLPIIESSRWHPAPGRGTGERVAATIGCRAGGGGDLNPETSGGGNLIAHTLRGEGFDGGLTVMAHGQANAEIVSDGSPSLTCNHEAPIVFNTAQDVRFWRRVEKTDTCWLWKGAVKDTGYGVFWYNQRVERAHRVSWEMHHGPIPEGKCVLHTCDVRICVNPDHLWLGDYSDNNADMADKGRGVIPLSYGEKHGKAKLSDAQVDEIRASAESGVVLAKRYGVSKSTISSVRLGHTRGNGTSAMCVRMREGREGGGKGPLVSEDQSLTLATGNDHVLCTHEVVGSLCAESGPNTHGSRGVSGTQTMLQGYIQPTAQMQVRRLTPVECERLQGFPDGYTAIPWRGKPADQCPDGPRYKALGNSWAVPCARYIGERIKEVRP
jgi:DNA (cytosine-5)-methyltransferase 1